MACIRISQSQGDRAQPPFRRQASVSTADWSTRRCQLAGQILKDRTLAARSVLIYLKRTLGALDATAQPYAPASMRPHGARHDDLW